MCECMCARSVRTTCTCTNVSYERCVCVHPRTEASHPTVSHIRGVNKVCNIPSPSPSLRSVSSSAPSRTTASRKSVVQVRLHHWPRLHVLCRLAKVDLLMAVYQDEPSERIHSLEADFSSGRPCTTILPGAVTIFLLIYQEFERTDQVVTDSIWRRVCSKHFRFSAGSGMTKNSVRGLPTRLSTTLPHTSSRTAALRALKRPHQTTSSMDVSVAMKTHTRQCAPPCPSNASGSPCFSAESAAPCSVGRRLLVPPHCSILSLSRWSMR